MINSIAEFKALCADLLPVTSIVSFILIWLGIIFHKHKYVNGASSSENSKPYQMCFYKVRLIPIYCHRIS